MCPIRGVVFSAARSQRVCFQPSRLYRYHRDSVFAAPVVPLPSPGTFLFTMMVLIRSEEGGMDWHFRWWKQPCATRCSGRGACCMILITIMVQRGFLAAGRTVQRLHLVLFSPLLASNGTPWFIVTNEAVIEAFALDVVSKWPDRTIVPFRIKEGLSSRACSVVAKASSLISVLLEARLFYRVKWWQPWIVVFTKVLIEALALDVVSKWPNGGTRGRGNAVFQSGRWVADWTRSLGDSLPCTESSENCSFSKKYFELVIAWIRTASFDALVFRQFQQSILTNAKPMLTVFEQGGGWIIIQTAEMGEHRGQSPRRQAWISCTQGDARTETSCTQHKLRGEESAYSYV